MTYGQINGLLPNDLQLVKILGVGRSDLEIRVDRLIIVASLLPHPPRCHQVLIPRVGHRKRPALLLLNLVNSPCPKQLLMRACHPDRVVPHARVLEGLDGHLGLARLDEQRLGHLELLLLDARTRLGQQHVVAAAGVEVVCDPQRLVPVLLMDVHVDGLLGLLGVDEFLLSLSKPSLILKEHGVLEVHLGQLGLHASTAQLERLVKRPALCSIIDCLLDQPKLGKELRPSLPSQRDGPRVGHLLRCVDAPVRLGNADRIVPHVVCAVHIDRALPVLGLHIVPLSLLELALALELLRQVQVRLRE
mmetsp:Transcript_11352/g.27841  ORF Transcript_11352/g.27841 Transcript_11352/m.27841 type:complete len:304 (-) Transcript_11352:3301-4212(-)